MLTLHFFNDHPDLNEPPLEWVPFLKGKKLNELPGAYSDNYGNGDQKTVIDSKWIEIIHHKKLTAKIWSITQNNWMEINLNVNFQVALLNQSANSCSCTIFALFEFQLIAWNIVSGDINQFE